MRVLMIIERYFPIWGGAENQLRQLIPNLVAQGCEITVVTRRWHATFLEQELIEGIRVIRLGIPGSGWYSTGCFIVSLCLYLFRNRNNIDILHSHGAVNMGALCAVFSHLLGLKNVAKIASADRIPPLSRTMFGRTMLFLLKKFSAIISMTDEIDGELNDIKTPVHIIHRITNGVDSNRFKPASLEAKRAWRLEHDLRDDSTIVLFSSRLVPGKGLDILLEAWPIINQRFSRAYLVIVGSGINQEDSVEKQLKQKAEDENFKNVLFVGETDAPEHYLGISDIFVFPSRKEGFPNALLEAMSSGCAIVASQIGGVQAVFQNSDVGLTYSAEDGEFLADLLLLLLNNEKLRFQKGREARDFVKEHYSFNKISLQYMELYRQLC